MHLGTPMIGRVGLLLLVALACWLMVRFLEWRNLYFPSREMPYTPRDVGLAFEEVTFRTEDDVELHGWWVPAGGPAAGTVLVCHGNGGNISNRVGLLPWLNEQGWNVFLFDYRGYGRSRGLPTERGTYRDARAAYEWVRTRYEDAERPPVVVLGRSLGGAVAVQLALDKPVRGLVVESSFTSTVDMARHMIPFVPAHRLLRARYASVKKLPRVTVPVLIAHSPHDETVPYALGRALYEAAPEPRAFVELNGGHNDIGWESTPAYAEALQHFLTGAKSNPQQ